MGKWFFINRKKLGVFAALILLPFLFQNCSKNAGFQSISSSVSALCLSKLQSVNLVKLASNDQLSCEDSQHYSCETRFFNPEIADSSGDQKFCLSNDAGFCVNVNSRNFSTARARQMAGSSDSDFAEGGDYNHFEVGCHYFNKSNEMFLLKAEGASVEEALQKVISRCLDAKAGK